MFEVFLPKEDFFYNLVNILYTIYIMYMGDKLTRLEVKKLNLNEISRLMEGKWKLISNVLLRASNPLEVRHRPSLRVIYLETNLNFWFGTKLFQTDEDIRNRLQTLKNIEQHFNYFWLVLRFVGRMVPSLTVLYDNNKLILEISWIGFLC